MGKHLPEMKICHGPGDVTLTHKDYGRSCVAYNLNKEFDRTDQAELDDGVWRALVKTILATWHVADAAVLLLPHNK